MEDSQLLDLVHLRSGESLVAEEHKYQLKKFLSGSFGAVLKWLKRRDLKSPSTLIA